MFGPASSQVLAAAFSSTAPLSMRTKPTCRPPRGGSLFRRSVFHVTVNVCGWPTALVAFGVIEMLASTTLSGSQGPSDAL